MVKTGTPARYMAGHCCPRTNGICANIHLAIAQMIPTNGTGSGAQIEENCFGGNGTQSARGVLVDIDRGHDRAEQRVVGAMMGNERIPFLILLEIEINVDTISQMDFGVVVGYFLPIAVKWMFATSNNLVQCSVPETFRYSHERIAKHNAPRLSSLDARSESVRASLCISQRKCRNEGQVSCVIVMDGARTFVLFIGL
eukprot:scaffold174248_cov28-Attheya_sp.AAC.2